MVLERMNDTKAGNKVKRMVGLAPIKTVGPSGLMTCKCCRERVFALFVSSERRGRGGWMRSGRNPNYMAANPSTSSHLEFNAALIMFCVKL